MARRSFPLAAIAAFLLVVVSVPRAVAQDDAQDDLELLPDVDYFHCNCPDDAEHCDINNLVPGVGCRVAKTQGVVGGTIRVFNHAKLKTLDLKDVTSVNGGVWVDANPVLESADFSSVTWINGYIRVNDNLKLKTFKVDSLIGTVGGGIWMQDNPFLEEIVMRGVLHIDEEIRIWNMPKLTSVDFGLLETIGGYVRMYNMPQLQHVNMNLLERFGKDEYSGQYANFYINANKTCIVAVRACNIGSIGPPGGGSVEVTATHMCDAPSPPPPAPINPPPFPRWPAQASPPPLFKKMEKGKKASMPRIKRGK